MILADDASTGVLFGGVIGIIIFVVLLMVAIMWMVFPFVVIARFNELIKEQMKTNELLKKIPAERTGGAIAPPAVPKKVAAATPSEGGDVYKI